MAILLFLVRQTPYTCAIYPPNRKSALADPDTNGQCHSARLEDSQWLAAILGIILELVHTKGRALSLQILIEFRRTANDQFPENQPAPRRNVPVNSFDELPS